MSYRVLDTFKAYSGVADFDKGWFNQRGFLSGSYDLIVRPEPGGPFGKYAAVFGAGSGSQVAHGNLYHRLLESEHEELAFSVDFKLGSSAYVAQSLYHLSDKKAALFVPTQASQVPLATLSVEIMSRVPRVYHSIVTGKSPSNNQHVVNKQLLGEFSSLVAGESYTLQMRGRITEVAGQKTGMATVILNGEVMNLQFDPNRVTPMEGFDQTGFNVVSTASVRSTTAVASETLVSDLTIYTPDEETPWPMGPVDLQTLQTTNVNLAVGPVNESTFVVVDQSLEFELDDPTGEILGAAVMVRANALGGNVPVGFEIDLVNGEQSTRVVEKDIAPGFASVIDTRIIDKSLVNAGTKIRARSIPR